MARIVAQSIFKPATPEWGNAVLFRMQDATLWILTLSTTPSWIQAPAIAGGRVVSNIDYNLGAVYACCTDGSIWSGVVQAGFTWQQIAQTPN